jgi:hypothetical protein
MIPVDIGNTAQVNHGRTNGAPGAVADAGFDPRQCRPATLSWKATGGSNNPLKAKASTGRDAGLLAGSSDRCDGRANGRLAQPGALATGPPPRLTAVRAFSHAD